MKQKLLYLLTILAIAGFILPQQVMAQGTYYVKQGGTGTGEESWDNATDLAEALKAAREGDVIWVAAGTYVPEYIAGDEPSEDARDKAFVIPAGVTVLGGFPEAGGTLEQRDWVGNETILSGDIDNTGDNNCYHVVIMALKDSEYATLDGFTITGGYATTSGSALITVNEQEVGQRQGAGIWASGKALVTNNRINGNKNNTLGGGIYAIGSVRVTNNTISKNEANISGGGIYAMGSVLVANNTISGNSVSFGNGSGVYATDYVQVTNNILWKNKINGTRVDMFVASAYATLSHNLIGSEPALPKNYSRSSDNLIGSDPLFVDADKGDYSLQPGSPCVNTGDNEVYLKAMDLKDFENALDLAGNPRLKGSAIDIGAYEYQSADVAVTYHTLTLDIASGIELYNLTAGTIQVEEGSHLHLQFLPEDQTLGADDVLLLIDGVETSFKDFGANHYFSYILNPITQDHTVEIALREYTVTLPEVQGITYDVGAGMHNVAYGNSFTFRLTLADEIDPADVHVFANGQEIVANELRSTVLTYTLAKVTTSIVVMIKGAGNPTGNMNITEGDIQLQITNSELHIINSTATPAETVVYTLSGHLVTRHTVGTSATIRLKPGVYIVRAGNVVRKVVIGG